ncbi:MAG: chemotaxis protein CheA [Halothiobacillaceae bacterium]|nr:MAG: chemotaxis protein CheA [Halothiobacillaceae bacterium]
MDLTEFLAPFFEECFEMLQQMEGDLLALDGGDTSGMAERIGSIFRVAHSIKGGAGTFGFSRITEYTHKLEALLDAMRDGSRQMTPEAVRVLLETVDVLRDMLAAERDGTTANADEIERTLTIIRQMLNGESIAEPVSAPAQPAAVLAEDLPGEPEAVEAAMPDDAFEPVVAAPPFEESPLEDPPGWHVVFRPGDDIAGQGSDPLRILRELAQLGPVQTRVLDDDLPPVHSINPRRNYLGWAIALRADVPRDQVEDVFAWVMDQAEVSIEPLGAGVEPAPEADASVWGESPAEFVSAEPTPVPTPPARVGPDEVVRPGDVSPQAVAAPAQPAAKPTPAAPAPAPASASAPAQAPTVHAVPARAAAAAPGGDAGGSIRVGIDKVDAIIDLVGELVITQSMLGQFSEEVERDGFEVSMLQRLKDGLSQLERNTRELQENVMRIRMLPISVAFNRFPRLVHDLSRQLGKQIELKISGENTELDKTVLEKIGDPLVHLVRNALDHGLEPVDERRAAGKPDTGTLRLNAYHKGGNIIIEIGEDGRGINKARVLAKAREKGLVGADEQLSDDRIHELIFAPGFSTAEQVTDISGRGVGMDVVKRNIHALGGGLEIRSAEGKGTTFVIRLPLTLSIMDSQLVVVGEQTYILPLMSIVESLQIAPDFLSRVAGRAEVYKLREDYIPVIRLNRIFNIPARAVNERPLLVVIEGDGQKVGLMIDDLLGQQQVVIKSLETNFRRIEGLSGSTILGDGTVALILDIGGLFQMGRRLENRKGAAA